MTAELLTPIQIENALGSLPEWSREGDSIHKTFRFEDFQQAFAWMIAIAHEAEERNHHPDWRNVYNTVEVTLTTHDAGGLTSLDFDLAREMNAAQRTIEAKD